MTGSTKITVTDIKTLGSEEAGQYLVTDGNNNITLSGGVGDADFTLWSSDAPPASGYSYFSTADDEFDDASFDSSLWAEFDVDTTQTVTETVYGLYLTTTTTGSIQGIYQPVPSGISDWSFTVRLNPVHGQANDQKPGIMLLEDINNHSTSDCYMWINYRGSAGGGFQAFYHTDYNSWSADDFNEAHSHLPFGAYLRFRRDGTNWYFDYSENGVHWVNAKYSRAKRFTVTGIGIGQRLNNTTDWLCPFQFARFTNNSDADQMLYGDRVKGWRA